jgi:hypothetical protein
MSLDTHLQYVAKFGQAAGYRSVLVRVTGYNFASVIYSAANFGNNVRNHLANNGIGVNGVTVEAASNQITGYYSLLIDINAQNSDDAQRIRSLVYSVLTADLSSLTVDIISGGDIPTNPSENGGGWIDQGLRSIGLGGFTGVNDKTETGALGMSTATIAIIAVGIVLLQRK